MSIQPIPTKYNGYSFRSRLEARWAYFFDLIDLPYVYEPQPYRCGPTGGYLPDFWNSAVNTFIEVKPYYPSMHEIEKAKSLCIRSGKSVELICGDPYGVVQAHWYTFFPWKKDLGRETNPFDLMLSLHCFGDSVIHIDERGFVFAHISKHITVRLCKDARSNRVVAYLESAFKPWAYWDISIDKHGLHYSEDEEMTDLLQKAAIDARMHQFWKPKQ